MSSQDKDQPPYYFSLQPSEMAIFRSACQIYAAYISSGQATPDNASQFHMRAIQEAIKIGMLVEKSVESDGEMKRTGS